MFGYPIDDDGGRITLYHNYSFLFGFWMSHAALLIFREERTT